MFTILKEKIFGKQQLKVVNKKTNEYITIIPECGGLINELVLQANQKNLSILNGYTSADELAEFRLHKGSKLIPFPNRIKDGKYEFGGNIYQLPLNHAAENHAIHGFIYDKKFDVINTEIQANEVTINLENIYEGTHQGFPFKFLTELICTLTVNDGFHCQTLVQNIDDRPLPFGDGWHPYFTLHKKVDELMLKIPSLLQTEVDSRMIPTGKVLDFGWFNRLAKINDIRLDTGFRIDGAEGYVETELCDLDAHVKIKIYQETGPKKYNFLQVYIPPSRDSIAIEPMTGNIDAFNNKDGLIILEPDELFEASYGVQLERC